MMAFMTDTARTYHQFTSYDRFAMSPHYLDWQNQPSQFKHYPEMMPVSLPEVSGVSRPLCSPGRAKIKSLFAHAGGTLVCHGLKSGLMAAVGLDGIG